MAYIHDEFTDDEMRELLTAVLTEIRRDRPTKDNGESWEDMGQMIEDALANRRTNMRRDAT